MKSLRGILEYCVEKPAGKAKGKWGFRFITPEGHTLIESAQQFDSQAKAEEGFLAFIKSIATNQYLVTYPEHSRN